MYAKLSIENALFASNTLDSMKDKSSSTKVYQKLKSMSDVLGALTEKYTFLNGKKQGDYEADVL